jgi:hypothetical protein
MAVLLKKILAALAFGSLSFGPRLLVLACLSPFLSSSFLSLLLSHLFS